MDEQDRLERLQELRRERQAKLGGLMRALTRCLDRQEPFAAPNGALFLELIQIEARIQELR